MNSKKDDFPELINKTAEELEEVLRQIKASNLPDGAEGFIIGCINLATWLPNAIEEKNITIRQLQKLIFWK